MEEAGKRTTINYLTILYMQVELIRVHTDGDIALMVFWHTAGNHGNKGGSQRLSDAMGIFLPIYQTEKKRKRKHFEIKFHSLLPTTHCSLSR